MVEEVLLGPGVVFTVPENISAREISDSNVNDLATDKNSQKVFASVRMPEQYLENRIPKETGTRILVLEGVQDPGNVGTLIRSAVAFGFSGIVMDRNSADPFSPKAVHSSAGSVLVPWILRDDNLMDVIFNLKSDGFKVFATDLKGNMEKQFDKTEKLALVMGNEGNGISDEIRNSADVLFKIPMDSKAVESLNVGAAGAVAMFMVGNIDI